MNNRNSIEEIKRMREAAIKHAKATQARSQIDLNSSRSEFVNGSEEKMSGNKMTNNSLEGHNVKSSENTEFKSTHTQSAFKRNKNNKTPFDGITNILKDILKDTDKTLILVLIFLLMDNEENLPILLVLLYLLI